MRIICDSLGRPSIHCTTINQLKQAIAFAESCENRVDRVEAYGDWISDDGEICFPRASEVDFAKIGRKYVNIRMDGEWVACAPASALMNVPYFLVKLGGSR